MGWSIGGPDQRGRLVGYGVPAYCDHPKCDKKIDRGLAYVCGGQPYGGDFGCGLYFCERHFRSAGDRRDNVQLCPRCIASKDPYVRLKPEHPEWVYHLLNHASWGQWRLENPKKVAALKLLPASPDPDEEYPGEAA